jgi:hypothetical protein
MDERGEELTSPELGITQGMGGLEKASQRGNLKAGF